uniref:Uncharacterized protein n=1 Tax=Solanum tuberosum TaxID=4113 RepID=M1D8X7_SOLTU
MRNMLLKPVTFGEKPEVVEGTRRLAKSPIDHPFSAPLKPSYTVTFDMTRSKAAERILPSQKKSKGITINESAATSRGKATKHPITGGKGKGKKSTYDRKTTIRDPNVPS